MFRVLSLPLLYCGPIKHISHACCLLLKELAVLGALLGPSRVKWCGVLVHQVSVLGTPRPTKVFDLMTDGEGVKVRGDDGTWNNRIVEYDLEFKVMVKACASGAVTRLTCMTLGKMVLLKWSSRVGALKSLLKTSSSSSCSRWHLKLREPLTARTYTTLMTFKFVKSRIRILSVIHLISIPTSGGE